MEVAIDGEAPSLGEVMGAGDSAHLAQWTTNDAVYARVQRVQIPSVTRVGKQRLVRRVGLLDWLDDRDASSPHEHK